MQQDTRLYVLCNPLAWRHDVVCCPSPAHELQLAKHCTLRNNLEWEEEEKTAFLSEHYNISRLQWASLPLEPTFPQFLQHVFFPGGWIAKVHLRLCQGHCWTTPLYHCIPLFNHIMLCPTGRFPLFPRLVILCHHKSSPCDILRTCLRNSMFWVRTPGSFS